MSSKEYEYIGSWNKTHGGSKTRLYRIWKQMRIRCNCHTNPTYRHYGARGIRICSEWSDFSAFRDWAVRNGYNDSLTIERKDFNGDYAPDNCEWIPREKQSLNTRNCKRYEHGGEKHTHNEWARIIGISPSSLTERIRNHGIERALTAPKGVRGI